jgi:polar amino acid transport system permease protein
MTFSLEFLLSQLPNLWGGLLLTVGISAVAIALSLVGGLCGGALRAYRVPLANEFLIGYVELFRNTPFAVQLFFVYFGLPELGIVLPGVAAGALALTLLGTAFCIENFRAAFEAIPRDPVAAAHSLGMSRRDIFFLISLPIAIRIAVRPLTNTAILILKDSSILYLISVHELTYTAINTIAVTYRTFEMFVALGFIYLALVVLMAAGAALYERRLQLSLTV